MDGPFGMNCEGTSDDQINLLPRRLPKTRSVGLIRVHRMNSARPVYAVEYKQGYQDCMDAKDKRDHYRQDCPTPR